MTPLSPTRRLGLAAAALAVAFVLFHGQLAAAVVTRGDDALRAGDAGTAIRLYERAAQLDPGSIVAADRLAFHLALRHDRPGAQRAIAVATRTLAVGHADPALFADRAFAELSLRRWRDAERDFARAGALAHDARFDHFAGRMALRSADRVAARRYALLALADDPGFTPARVLLRTLR
jgi:tetratricopeptide (TPR) repeat protein